MDGLAMDAIQVRNCNGDDDRGRLSPAAVLRRNVNNVVQPLLTDLYQITMAYAYWKSGKKDSKAAFDLFFRKNPFHGEFTIFAGLEECVTFIQNFNYTVDDITYLKTVLPETTEAEFFDYLLDLNARDLSFFAIPEGSVVFPKVPIIRVEGPLPVCQLLETTLLTLVNYASLVTTNAARYRLAAQAAKDNIQLLEFGLRRAQGPDGGLSASRYAYLGGFDATSNVLAGKLYGIPVKGTHAHAFVMSYRSTEELLVKTLKHKETGEIHDFVSICEKRHEEVSKLLNVIHDETSSGEFAAFIAYALAFPDAFLALVDTYDVVRSGVVNFCSVALALSDLGYRPFGVRIDSGDLAYLSQVVLDTYTIMAKEYDLPWFTGLAIVASNDINEDTIFSLNDQGHKINYFGIGTHLVTCQRQPALGCVYKLVEIEGQPCIKLSLDVNKVTIPGRKNVFRLYGQDGSALLDLMQRTTEPKPEAGQRVLCRHPFQESKRAYVTPAKVETILRKYWDKGHISHTIPSIEENRRQVAESLQSIRGDIKRHLNPTPYKVSVSADLYQFMHDLWLQNAPIGELA